MTTKNIITLLTIDNENYLSSKIAKIWSVILIFVRIPVSIK